MSVSILTLSFIVFAAFNVTFMFNVTSDLYVSENATVMCTVMGGFPTPDVSISFPTVEDVTFYDQTMTTMTADDNTTTGMSRGFFFKYLSKGSCCFL